MFIAVLFIIARTWTQPRCPSAEEWIKKMWYIYTWSINLLLKTRVSQNSKEIGGTRKKYPELGNTDLER